MLLLQKNTFVIYNNSPVNYLMVDTAQPIVRNPSNNTKKILDLPKDT